MSRQDICGSLQCTVQIDSFQPTSFRSSPQGLSVLDVVDARRILFISLKLDSWRF